MLTNEQKSVLIEQMKSDRKFSICGSNLPIQPTFYDLIKFLKLKNPKKWIHNKRYRKKLVRNLSRYLPKHIYYEYMAKIFVRPLLPRLNYSELARKLVVIEPLPEGALPLYDKTISNCCNEPLCSQIDGSSCDNCSII
jgi:hypothetical protein